MPNGQINLTLTNAKKLGDRVIFLSYPLASVYSSDIVGVSSGNDSHNEWRKKTMSSAILVITYGAVAFWTGYNWEKLRKG